MYKNFQIVDLFILALIQKHKNVTRILFFWGVEEGVNRSIAYKLNQW
jgi:hypothetical protein